MTQPNQHPTSNRFFTITVSEFLEANGNPIFGYENETIMPLEDAITSIIPLVPEVKTYAKEAMEKRRRNTHLTRDESASIYLYTMPKQFYVKLNEALRYNSRDGLTPWFAWLKLFITALQKLPSY